MGKKGLSETELLRRQLALITARCDESEQARIESEQARIESEQARIESEQARIESEQALTESEQARIESEQARIESEQARIESEQALTVAELKIERLSLENKRLAMRLYGRRSETLTREELGQLVLALGGTKAEAEAVNPNIPLSGPEDAEPEDVAEKPKKRRKRKNKTVVSDSVVRVVTEVRVPEDERACLQCGHEMKCFGHVERETIELIPARFEVNVERREKLGCKQKGCGAEAITADRKIPLRSTRVGVSLLAELIENKCDDALPVHRQCDRFRRLGVDIPASTAYGYWRYATDPLVMIAEALLGVVMEDPDWVGVDDTGLDVLDRSRAKGKYRGHLWCFRASSGLVAYQFTETWEAKEIAGWLALLGPKTHVQVDDYKGYSANVVVDGISRVVVPPERRLGCMMHVRRRYYEALKLGDKRAAKAVGWIKEIYKVEELGRGKSPSERLALRSQHSIALLDKLEAWNDEIEASLGKTGKLADAVRYARQQRVYIRRCFMDGRFELDNGACERQIRRPAMGRRNFLFTGSADAGRRLAAAYTIVQTCRNRGIVVREYLVDVLTKLENGWPARRLTELLPHRWQALREA